VFNAHPILFWNAVEIFLYIFANNLLINPAYRVGKARVGCIICPFSSFWDDMIIQKQYPQELQPFTDRLQRFSSQVKIQDFERYIAERKWKLKPLAERTQPIPRVSFKTSLSDLDFLAEIIDAKNSLLDWLPAVCDFTIKQTKNGNEGELNYKKQVYPFFIEQNDNVTNLKVEGKLPNDFLFLLRRLVFKTAFCVHCEVCEVDCPTGALTIVPSINIDNSKCTHCHKCFNSHDRGCIAADCSRMITDSEKKLNAKVQGYKKFGLREIWIDEYSVNPVEFWKDNTLGTAQEDSLKAWLRDAEVIDKKNNLTEIGELMMNLYKETPSLFWEIAFINLSYNSFIVKWFTNNIVPNQIYNSKIIIEEISNQSYTGSLATVGNAALAFVDMVKKSPIGDDFVQGVEQGKDGLQREEYNDLSIEAVAYSIYRLAITHGVTMLRVADLYNKNEEYGPYKEFMISKQALLKKLRTISSSNNRVLTAELTMGLDHITLRQDLNHIEALKEMTK
jgi:phosphoadenosine phosphosulfate reductase